MKLFKLERNGVKRFLFCSVRKFPNNKLFYGSPLLKHNTQLIGISRVSPIPISAILRNTIPQCFKPNFLDIERISQYRLGLKVAYNTAQLEIVTPPRLEI